MNLYLSYYELKIIKYKRGLLMVSIKEYDIFEGIKVSYNDIHVDKIISKKSNIDNIEIYEINHCREGRFECELKDGTITYMEAGDFAINPLKNCPEQSNFPISHYHGLTIYITPSEFGEDVILLEKIFKINYQYILNKLCMDERLFIKRATPEIQHIFQEIYNVSEAITISYLKIKIQELFIYLSSLDMEKEYTKREYFAKSNVDLVKKIYSFINEHLEENHTYEKLSVAFCIKPTTMKKCYKSVYGETINETIRKNRLKKAADLLRITSKNITDISMDIGYLNNAKFSTAFKKMYNISPSEYRKVIALSDKNGLIGEE